MKASALEFRLRVWISLAIILLGFFSPWIEWLHWGAHTTTWLWMGIQLRGLGLTSADGIIVTTWIAIVVAAIAAAVRVWGTAYLGAGVMTNSEMKAGHVLADGPYRHVRNPLYLGSWLMVAAITLLMPVSGAAVTLVLTAVFLLRIILGEEAFLLASLGEPYVEYKRRVPRLLPSLRPRVPAGGRQPAWGRALLAEITPLGVLISYAALSWRYDASLLMRAVLISFGLSLLVRAVMLPPAPTGPITAAVVRGNWSSRP